MTALWTSQALMDATGGQMDLPFDATGVSIDTRTLKQGDLFVALVGERDGHAHVADALACGAAGVMVHQPQPAGTKALLVQDTLLGLHALGRAGRARFTGRLAAITGSVGKTTTKEMLRTALAACGPTHAAVASYNNHWGLPLTLARLPPEAAFCVAEIGMNQPGEVAPLAALAAPHVAVITTIAAAHIGHLGSLDAIADEKAALLSALRPGGVAVLPADSAYFPRLAEAAPPGATIMGFGRAETADIRLLSNDAGLVRLRAAGQDLTVRLAAPGAHMAQNAAAALSACAALGVDLHRAAAALETFAPGAGRGLQRELGGILMLDESYNANPASMRAALHVLRDMPGVRRVAVLGDMLELGGFAPGEHAGLAAAVQDCADVLYACGPLMRHLFDAVPTPLRGILADDADSLAPVVAAAIRPGDAVLVKGSLGSRMKAIVTGLEAHLAGGPG